MSEPHRLPAGPPPPLLLAAGGAPAPVDPEFLRVLLLVPPSLRPYVLGGHGPVARSITMTWD